MHANRQKPCLHWTALALLATSTLTSGGCAKFFHIWHYNHLNRTMHEEHRLSYYHSPHTGRIIPKEHHLGPMVEFPCFGYESTCWHRWPEECGPCPVQGPEVMLMDGGPFHGQIVEEVIEQPPAEQSPLDAAPGRTVPPPPADGPAGNVPRGDGLPGSGLLDDGLPNDLPTSPLPDDASLRPRGADHRRQPTPSDDATTNVPSSASQPDFDHLARADDAPAGPSAEGDLESPAAVEPAGPTYVENTFVNEPPATPQTSDPRPHPVTTSAKPDPATSAQRQNSVPAARPVKQPPSRRVAQRSSRRVRPSADASDPALAAPAAPSAPAGGDSAPVDGPDVSRNVPATESGLPSEPSAPAASASVSARPVVSSHARPSTVAAVHRSGSSRRPGDSTELLPSFTIVPVVSAPSSSVATPLQITPGPGNTLRFVSETPPAETRVADQSAADDTMLRFR